MDNTITKEQSWEFQVWMFLSSVEGFCLKSAVTGMGWGVCRDNQDPVPLSIQELPGLKKYGTNTARAWREVPTEH